VAKAQETDFDALAPPVPKAKYTPFTLRLGDRGENYLRIINWNQFAVNVQEGEGGSTKITPALKRVRVLTYAKLDDKILLLTHFGVNNLTADGLHPTGQSSQTQLFLHGAWGQVKLAGEYLHAGAGLHYFNGLSRISNAGTLNFLTYDNYRQAWAQLGLSDQFGRHLGIFIKGRFNRLNYHLSLNDPLTHSLDVAGFAGEPGSTGYVGKYYFPEQAGYTVQGYADYQFLEKESNELPYRTGTYLGAKKVFNVGAGFFSHPGGSVHIAQDSTVQLQDVRHFAIDAFYDAPIGANGAISAYAVFYKFNYGKDYVRSDVYATGNNAYAQVGYLLPGAQALRLQPYVTWSSRGCDKYDNTANSYGVGLNLMLFGHNAKLTTEYRSSTTLADEGKDARSGQLNIQAMLFL
jgi:hypothetical protein